MRILVCGSRTFNDKQHLIRILNNVVEERCKGPEDEYGNWLPVDLTIVNGKAKGADNMATDWAAVNWVSFEEHPADWDKYGRAAGLIRNKQMLDTGVDLVIAFPRGEARGTKHMMKIAREAGVEVIEA
jgi:hypothetical protein